MTNKIAILAALFTLIGSQAHAKSILPPSKYDHPFEGTIIVKRNDSGSLPCRPRSLSIRYGCAFLSEDGKECEIHLAYTHELPTGMRENDLWRHEIARCNGWQGYRPLGDDSLVRQLDRSLGK
jgi:hypothetical protein